MYTFVWLVYAGIFLEFDMLAFPLVEYSEIMSQYSMRLFNSLMS